MFKKVKEKPVIIAICGKSASGKTSLAKYLAKYFTYLGLPAHMMVGATTRPKRSEEVDEEDYYFMSEEEFLDDVLHGKIIDPTQFKQWYYGTQFKEIDNKSINIGIFSPEGLRKLRRYKYKYMVVPVLLEEKRGLRLRRMYDREHGWKLEYGRRMLADFRDFQGVKGYIQDYFEYKIYLRDITDIVDQTLYIRNSLVKMNIIRED